MTRQRKALLEAIQREGVLAVFGSRVLGAQARGERRHRSVFRFGGDFVNWAYQRLFGSRLTDVASCYKMAPRTVLQGLKLTCDGFDLDYEIAAKLQLLARQRGEEIAELPIKYAPRTVAQGKKIRWRDGMRALWTLWRVWWRRGK